MSDVIYQSGPNSYLVLLTRRGEEEVELVTGNLVRSWQESDYGDSVGLEYACRVIKESGSRSQ